MVRIAGSAAMKRKNCGPTQTVTAKMCSQGVTASDIPSDYTLKPDRLFAFGAHGDEANFHAEHILYEANIRLRLRGQVPEPSYAGSLLLPTRKLFIYRLSGGERGAGGRHRIGLFAMNTVSGADLDGWQRIQYVEARKSSGGKAVDADAVARGDTVEPAAAAGAARWRGGIVHRAAHADGRGARRDGRGGRVRGREKKREGGGNARGGARNGAAGAGGGVWGGRAGPTPPTQTEEHPSQPQPHH